MARLLIDILISISPDNEKPQLDIDSSDGLGAAAKVYVTS